METQDTTTDAQSVATSDVGAMPASLTGLTVAQASETQDQPAAEAQSGSVAPPPRVPTEGDAVLFWPQSNYQGSYPIAGSITKVWSDTCVNLTMPTSDGSNYEACSVFLARPGAVAPAGYCARLVDELQGEIPFVGVYGVSPQPKGVGVPIAADGSHVNEAPVIGVARLEDARALPEVPEDEQHEDHVPPSDRHIGDFLDHDGRVMRIVHWGRALAKRAIASIAHDD